MSSLSDVCWALQSSVQQPCWVVQLRVMNAGDAVWLNVQQALQLCCLLPCLCSALPVHDNNELPCVYAGLCICYSEKVYLVKLKSIVSLRMFL